VQRLSSVEPPRARASGLRIADAGSVGRRAEAVGAPAANSIASARLVLPAPAGPTSAITRVPLILQPCDSPLVRFTGARVAFGGASRALPRCHRPPVSRPWQEGLARRRKLGGTRAAATGTPIEAAHEKARRGARRTAAGAPTRRADAAQRLEGGRCSAPGRNRPRTMSASSPPASPSTASWRWCRCSARSCSPTGWSPTRRRWSPRVRTLTAVLPREVAELIGEQLMNVVQTSGGKKGLGLLLALAHRAVGRAQCRGLDHHRAQHRLRGGGEARVPEGDLAWRSAMTVGAVVLALLAGGAIDPARLSPPPASPALGPSASSSGRC
jgi:hypothetical protein